MRQLSSTGHGLAVFRTLIESLVRDRILQWVNLELGSGVRVASGKLEIQSEDDETWHQLRCRGTASGRYTLGLKQEASE